MTALNSNSDFPFLLMGIGSQTKSKRKNYMCWLNVCYLSTAKGLHRTKWKKNLEFYRKIPSCTNLLICLLDMILYVPSTIFQLNSDGSSWVKPVLS